jgi:hypothetical protein
MNLKVKSLSRPMNRKADTLYNFELKTQREIALRFKFEAKAKNNIKEWFLV